MRRRSIYVITNGFVRRRRIGRDNNSSNSTIINLKRKLNRPLSEKVKELEERNKYLQKSLKKKFEERLQEINNDIDEYFNCQICTEKYNKNEQTKMVLTCNHNCCLLCLNKWFIEKGNIECPFCKQHIDFKKDLEFEEKVMKTMNEINDKIFSHKIKSQKSVEIKKSDLFTDLNNGKYKCNICRNSRSIYQNWKNHALFHKNELKKLYGLSILFID